MRQLDGRCWVGLGTVLPAQGGDHFDTHDGEDLTVEVELHPSGTRISCRVASAAGGADAGVWGIPEPGEEVAVVVPDGEEDAGGIIVGTLSSGSAPGAVARRAILVRAVDRVVVQAPSVVVEADQVQLGADGLLVQQGVVNGEAIDPFTGLTQFALGNASSAVKARKV